MHQEAEQGLGKFWFIESNFKIGNEIKSRPDNAMGTGLLKLISEHIVCLILCFTK